MSDVSPPAAPGYKRCPACAEEIRAEAVICRFCHYDLRTSEFVVPTYGPAPGQPYGRPMAPARTNTYAIASLVLGIVNMLIGSILALVFGYRAIREIDESQGTQTGRGLAVAGVVLGWVGLVMGILWLILFALVFIPNSGHIHFGQ